MKAIFPSGINEITIEPVTQWDYGQTLEFEGDLPAVFEVHFAHKGIKQAIVRSCSTASSVTIPDICLEQTSTVVAWVYEIGETSGKTIKTVFIPVTPRVRPEPEEVVPVEIVDKYNESIAAINDLIETINTSHSATSDFATRASSASSADFATVAHRAHEAESATKASFDAYGNSISSTYLKSADAESIYAKPSKIIRQTDDTIEFSIGTMLWLGYFHIGIDSIFLGDIYNEQTIVDTVYQLRWRPDKKSVAYETTEYIESYTKTQKAMTGHWTVIYAYNGYLIQRVS